MKLHEIKYEHKETGVVHREFAASESEASKRCTALKMAAKGKPVRGPVEIPTDKAGLIDWLNTNAKVVGA